MPESRPEDALVKLEKTVEIVETAETVNTVETVETEETEDTHLIFTGYSPDVHLIFA